MITYFIDGEEVPEDYFDKLYGLFDDAIEGDPGEENEPPFVDGQYQWTKENNDGR